LEALLFCSDHPVEVKELARAAGLDRKRTAELLQRLIELYAQRGLRLEHVAEGYSFRTHPRYADFVRKMLAARPVRLSRAQLETLAIIAYRQPVTRPDVDDIRGVDSGPVLKGLLERDLIKIIGKKDEPGRPILYGTSKGFLELFNLTSLADLPTLRDFVELSEESRRKFAEETGEDAPEEPLSELAAAAASAETGEMAQANLAAAAIAETDAAETKAEAVQDEESDEDEDEESDEDDEESDEDDEESDEDDESDDDEELGKDDDSVA
jgi:segregation and condensation protein B